MFSLYLIKLQIIFKFVLGKCIGFLIKNDCLSNFVKDTFDKVKNNF